MEFSRLHENDYEEFKTLLNDFRETEFSYDDFVKILSELKNTDIIICKKNGSLIGTITVLYETKFIFGICTVAHIEDLCVKHEYRNTGIGKMLVKNAIEIAKEKKCYKVTLSCSIDIEPFYLKCGFEKRGFQMSMLV